MPCLSIVRRPLVLTRSVTQRRSLGTARLAGHRRLEQALVVRPQRLLGFLRRQDQQLGPVQGDPGPPGRGLHVPRDAQQLGVALHQPRLGGQGALRPRHDHLTALAAVDLPAPDPTTLQPDTALDDLETSTHQTGNAILRRVLQAQGRGMHWREATGCSSSAHH